MTQAHSTKEWSHLRSNSLELLSSLRSKWLTEGYYASLAWYLSRFVSLRILNTGRTVFRKYYSNRWTTPELQYPNSAWPNSVLQSGCYSTSAHPRELGPLGPFEGCYSCSLHTACRSCLLPAACRSYPPRFPKAGARRHPALALPRGWQRGGQCL
jgi:hypothetical protein